MKKKVNIIILLIIILIASSVSYAGGTNTLHDIKSTDWFNKDVTMLINLGGISGYPDGTFKPNSEMTKAEFVKTLISSLGYNNIVKTGTHWASGYMDKAEKLHIINKELFKDIDKPISRFDMARIISNTLTYKKETSPTNLSDYQSLIKDLHQIKDSSLMDCVLESYVKGIVSGYPDGSFSGDKTLTRAEASSVIVRILNKELRQVPKLSANITFESEVLKLVNLERKKAGLPQLVSSKSLDSAAKLKSEDMGINNYFEHESPNYGSPFKMMDKLGIKYKAAGENIAKGYKTPEAVVKGWMDSPGHRANILNTHFSKMGIGIYFGTSTYWTQLFTD